MSSGTRSPNYKPTGGAPPPGKYLHDFSKALASEVRILLEEVGKLREERRALQIEIAELMNVKSRHGNPHGEYIPDWQRRFMPEALEEPPQPPPPEEPSAPAKPGWRVVHKPRQAKEKKALPAPAAPAPPPEPLKANIPSWAQWKPNPLITPQTSHALSAPVEPSSMGLFGPEK